MAIELARVQALPRPWGVVNLQPWIRAGTDGLLIGEVWFERPGNATSDPSLLLKLLFTNQPLSIQVHPDDAFAQSMGLSCGKTEAWYILNAAPGAKIALGLKQRLSSRQLRAAVVDGSILDLVSWRTVSTGEAVFVPAGTIHAIGAGLVIAEIQQRSDATFRMFDFGRKRDLHLESAIAVADAGPAYARVQPRRMTDERTLLLSNPHFAFERFDLPPSSAWRLEADRETWLLVVSGSARVGSFEVVAGDAVFGQSDRIDIHAGAIGMVGLAAYTGAGGPVTVLLQRVAQAGSTRRSEDVEAPTSLAQTSAASANGRTGTME